MPQGKKTTSLASEISELRGNVGAIFNEKDEQVALLLDWRVKSQSLLGVVGVRITSRGLWLEKWEGIMYALLYAGKNCYRVENVKFVKPEDIPVELSPWDRVYLGQWEWVGQGLTPV